MRADARTNGSDVGCTTSQQVTRGTIGATPFLGYPYNCQYVTPYALSSVVTPTSTLLRADGVVRGLLGIVKKAGNYMTEKRTTRHSCNYTAPTSTLVKRDVKSLSQLEYERLRAENFQTGSMLAAMLLCIMFLVLSLGCWWFGW